MYVFHLGSAYPFMIKGMMHCSALLEDENPLHTRKNLKLMLMEQSSKSESDRIICYDVFFNVNLVYIHVIFR